MALGRGNIGVEVRAIGLEKSIAKEARTAERNLRPMSLSLDDKGFRQPLGRITGDLGEFQNALDASVARTLAFGAAVGVINSMANAFKGMVTSAIEVEKALADVNVILNLTSSGLANFSTNLFQVAANTGQSFQTVSEAAVELARQGLGAEESLKRINDAMILTRLSGMDAAKSVASLTAAVNSFGDTAITTTEVVNKLASVDAAFAVSTDDLANALARAGASAQGAKVDMDQLLAAVTSVQQTTARGGAVIGNAFKSIFTRLQRGGVREALEDIGVATMDAAGNIRGAMDVLQDYAGVYSTLSDSQRAYTDELVAGVFQINNLKALIKDLGSDYSIYTRALDQSAGATDEAERRNRSLQTTLSALVNEAAVNVKQLASALGGLVATPAIENLLSVFNSVAGALSKALDPEKGSKLIKGMFGAIGKFISGPGLILVGLAFVKLFKFITGQSVKAVQEVFKINTAKQKTAQIEAQITSILKSNEELYERISSSSLTHEQREEMVLDTLQAQTLEYKQQAAMISKLGASRSVGAAVKGVVAASPSRAEGFIPRYAGGYIPNFANGMEGAVEAERKAITAGEGGASPGAKTKVLNNFPIGGGRNETMVANTDEVIVPRFGGSSGSAIFNKDMIKEGGMPEGAIPVAKGWIPNFALKGAGAKRAAQKEKSQAGKSSLLSDPEFSQFWNGSGLGTGTLEVNTQEATSGFGIIGGRGSPGLGKAGLKGPFANEALKSNFKKLAQGRMSINSREAEEFMKLFSKRKTSFTNIPINTVSNEPITRKDGESMLTSPISTMIQPYMADAVEKVSTQIYSNYFPRDFDTAGYIAGVRSAVDKDKEIVSRSVEGGILESALKLGTTESAKNIGADESATWDFEPAGTIPGYLKDNFFSGKKVIRADAKRTVNDEERGKVLKKATDEVFPAQLSAGILDSIGGKVLARAKKSFNRKKGKADGFIPSFAEEIKGKLRLPNSPPPFTRVKNFKTIQNVSRDIKELSTKKGLSNAKMPPRSSKGVKGKGKTQTGLKKTGQKADWEDEFSATVIPLFQRFNISEFSQMSAAITNAMLKDEAYANALLSGKMMQRADQSQIQGVRLTLAKIKKIKQARADYAKVPQKGAPGAIPDYITGKKSSTGKPSYGDWLKKTKKDSFTFNGKPVSLIGKEDRPLEVEKEKNRLSNSTVKGILGELYAAKGLKTTINQENDYFDLAKGQEVKTTATQPAIDILRKGVNKKLSEGANYYNNKADKINLGELDVVLPRGTKLTKGYRAGGFIPNFANSLDEAISREREVLQAQGSSAQIYTDTDSRVAGPQNPTGLLVANTRDEPRGGSQGVERVMKQGADPRINGAADGFVPSFIRLGRRRRSKRSRSDDDGGSTKNVEKATASIQELDKSSGRLAKPLGRLKGGMQQLETLSWKVAGLETALQGANGMLEVFGFRTLPTMTDAFMSLKDTVQGLNRPLIDAANNYSEALEKEISATDKTVEKIDLFATTTASLGKALGEGKIDVAGKQMQNLFIQASKLNTVDPAKLQELILAAGDSEGIKKATQELKDLENRGKNIKMFASDMSTFIGEVQSLSEEGRAGEVGKRDMTTDVSKLTEGLDPEQLGKIGTKLKEVDASSASLSKVLESLAPEIGVMPKNFLALADSTPEVSKGFIQALKDQTSYASALTELGKHFEDASRPVTVLTGRLNSLGLALSESAKSSAKAHEVLSSLADIEFQSQLKGAQDTGTVTEATALDATAIYDVQKSIDSAAQTSQSAIKDFAGKILQGADGNMTSLSAPLANLVKSVEAGAVDNNSILAAANSIANDGNAAQQTLAKELVASIQGASQNQIGQQLKIEATLRAQLKALDNQAVAYARTNQLNAGQLESLVSISSGVSASSGIQKTNLERVSELKSVLKTVGDLGGSKTDDFLAEIKESNAKLSQLENFKAALNQVTKGGGVPADFDAQSLEGLAGQIDQFVAEGSFGQLGDQAKDLVTALDIGLGEQIANSDGGVKTKEDLPPPVISTDSINELANALSQAVSEPLRNILGVEAGTADNLDVKMEEGLPQEIGALAAQNKTNAEANEALIKQQTEIVAQALAQGQAKQALAAEQGLSASSALQNAAEALLTASANLATPTSDPDPASAKGFVPSFSPKGAEVAKAVNTERKLGGKPVVDYHPTVGTYVRDGKTQSNFSAVKRDHPEGLRQASANAAVVQGVLGAEGYVPNFKGSTATPSKVGIFKWFLDKAGTRGKKVPVKRSPVQKSQAQKNIEASDRQKSAAQRNIDARNAQLKKDGMHVEGTATKTSTSGDKVSTAKAKAEGTGDKPLTKSQKVKGFIKDQVVDAAVTGTVYAGVPLVASAAFGEDPNEAPVMPSDLTPEQIANDENWADELKDIMNELESPFTKRGYSKSSEMVRKLIPEGIRDFGSQLGEIIPPAYFGGQRFIDQAESSSYPPFAKKQDMNYAYALAAHTMLSSGKTDMLKNISDFKGDGSLNMALSKEASAKFLAAKGEFSQILTRDFQGLVDWHDQAPHNDSIVKDSFGLLENIGAAIGIASTAIGGMGLLALPFFPPASAILGTLSSWGNVIAGGVGAVGSLGDSFTGTNIDGFLGIQQQSVDLSQDIERLWQAGMFHEEAPNFGWEADQIPRTLEESAKNKWKMQSITKERGEALEQLYSSGGVTFSPSLFPGVSSTRVGLGGESSQNAGSVLAGGRLSRNGPLRALLETGESQGDSTSSFPAVSALAGGPQFITNTSLLAALMEKVGAVIAGGENSKISLPLSLNPAGGVKLTQGSDMTEGTWVPSAETSKWSISDLKKTGDQMWDTERQTRDAFIEKKIGVVAMEKRLEAQQKASEGSSPNAPAAPTEKEMQDLADEKLWLMGLTDQRTGLRKGLSLVTYYQNMLTQPGNLFSSPKEWMHKPSFPDPFKQKEWISKQSLVNGSQRDSFYGFDFPSLTRPLTSPVFNTGEGNDATAQLNDFFEKMEFGWKNQGINGVERVKELLGSNNIYNEEIGRITSLFDPATAKEGYAAANKSLSNTQQFLSDSPKLWFSKAGVGLQQANNLAAASEVDKVFEEGLFEGEGLTKFEGENKIPTNPADLGPEEAPQPTNIEKVRDAVYMRILGKQADEKRAASKEVEADTIKRLQKVRETAPAYREYLQGIVERKKRTKASRQKMADKFASSSRASHYSGLVDQTQDEIDVLNARVGLFNQGDEGIAQLYYSDARKLTKVNDRIIAPSLWDAPSTAVEAFQALVKRLGLEQTPAEERLKEIEKGEGENRGIAAQLGLNWSQHLTEGQKSKNVGGYGFYAQIRDQEGNAGGQAFKDQFSSMAPEDRLNLMERLGVRAVEPDIGGSKVYEDLFSQNNEMAPLVKKSLMRFAGERNPAFGFMIDEIFQSDGANRERDAILNTVKELGIPFNDISPINELLDSAMVNIATMDSPGGQEVGALPAADVQNAISYLYEEQFKDWAERNKEKLEGEGVNPNIAYLNEILGEKSGKDLIKYPSYLKYLNDGGMLGSSLPQFVAGLLKGDASESPGEWKSYWSDNNAINYLLDNKDYGQTVPKSSLKTVPIINPLTGENQLKSLDLGDNVVTQAEAVKAVMGDEITHGTSAGFQSLVNPDGVPFPALGVPTGRQEAIRNLWDIAKDIKEKEISYAPFGYTEKFGQASPNGLPSKVKELIQLVSAQVDGAALPQDMGIVRGGPDVEVKPAAVNQAINAMGLVPNFAEILAQKKGEVDLIDVLGEAARGKYIRTGKGASAILEGDEPYLTQLPGDSSYLSDKIQSLAAEVSGKEVSLSSLGISSDRVSGGNEESSNELFDLSNIGDMVVEVKKLQRESSIAEQLANPTGGGGTTGIRGASGFVPNFSAVAGEIAASRAAGYKSPVTPGQVKTMNIPGAGKAAYNTQESVFKMPGVTQPFIRPPKTSDAAPSYAKEVKKKYNFNPYQNAAGGFVPNFKGAVDIKAFESAIRVFNSGTGKFNEEVGKFSSSVNNLDFSSLEAAAKEMSGASKAFTSQYKVLADAAGKIQEGAAKISEGGGQSLDIKPLTTAAGQFTKGVSSMTGALAKPLTLDTENLEKAMTDLFTALRDIQGEITIKMPDVTVNIQGLNNLDLSPTTKQAIADDVTAIVGGEIDKKTPGIVRALLT